MGWVRKGGASTPMTARFLDPASNSPLLSPLCCTTQTTAPQQPRRSIFASGYLSAHMIVLVCILAAIHFTTAL